MKQLSFDEIIRECLVAIFKEDLLKNDLYLKGGQALRLGEHIDKRLSTDIDFSSKGELSDNKQGFLHDALYSHFSNIGIHLFSYKISRRPRETKEGFPKWWSGFAIEFKLIDQEQMHLPIEDMERQAIRPLGAQGSPKIEIDISPFEYCGSSESFLIRGVKVNRYSKALLILEKLRAICQQHPDYKFRSQKKRSRDFYDISSLLDRTTTIKETTDLFNECKKHLPAVFSSKEVPLEILDKVFDEDFLKLQREDWELTKRTISANKDFDTYLERVKAFIRRIV